MSDTPRTDEQINGKPCTRFEILAGDSLRNAAVPSEFARTIERELNAANERIKRLVQAGDCLLSHRNSTDYHEKVREWDKAKKDKP
jgi:NAD(P)H-dependent FMN reductase